MFPKEAIEEFKKIWKKEFGEEISDAKALDRGMRLIRLVGVIRRETARAEHEALQKRKQEI